MFTSVTMWAQGKGGRAAQLTHILGDRLKKLAKDVKREKAFKDIVNTSLKEKG